MLTALEQGVRGGQWYTLMDKVYALPTLHAAFARVKANRGAPGVDHVTVAMFEARLDANPPHRGAAAEGQRFLLAVGKGRSTLITERRDAQPRSGVGPHGSGQKARPRPSNQA